jgi:hypothetical protein
MTRSISILGLGIFFALAGIGLFAFTLRKVNAGASTKPGVPLKKSELRELEGRKTAQKTETNKLRIAGAVCVAAGVALMVLS